MSFISSGCSSKCRITSSFASMRSSMYSPSWSVSPRTITGSRSWIRACTASFTTGGRSCHSCGCSRSMIRSTTLADLAARRRRDVVGDLVRLELAVEVADAADLQQRLVHRDAGHLGHPRRDDALPAEPAVVRDRRDHLHPARQVGVQEPQARDPHAVEPHRLEQHDHAGPVGDVADHAGEQRHRDQRAHEVRVTPLHRHTAPAPRRAYAHGHPPTIFAQTPRELG